MCRRKPDSIGHELQITSHPERAKKLSSFSKAWRYIKIRRPQAATYPASEILAHKVHPKTLRIKTTKPQGTVASSL
jgi:hypothetical protein